MVVDSPIDITSDITDQCSGLCSLSFNFGESACIVGVGGSFITSEYDSPPTDSKYFVKYKGVDYKPSSLLIVNKSLHLYNGKRTDAELIVLLFGTGDGADKRLTISVPIEQTQRGGSDLTDSGKIVKAIMTAVTSSSDRSAAAYFESGSVYTLNSVIPSEAPFYTYIGNDLYRDQTLVNYVVFPRSSSIYVPASTIASFNKITTQFVPPINFTPTNVAAYNSLGANIRDSNDVFIECSPAGDDGVILYQTTTTAGSSAANGDTPFTNIVENDIFVVGLQIIIFGFVGIIMVFLAYKLLMIISPVEKSATAGGGGGGARGGSGAK